MAARILPHIFQENTAKPFRFTPVGGGGDKPLTPAQNRLLHAKKLEEEIEAAVTEEAELLARFNIPSQDVDGGICLDVQSFEHGQLKYESLEDQRSHIELLNVRIEDGVPKASIYLPKGKQDLLRKINDYKDSTKDSAHTGEPRHQPLIDSIEIISRSELKSFWMDKRALPRNTADTFSWEAWLRKGAFDYLQTNAHKYGITLSSHKLKFPEREICLIKGSLNALALLQLVTKAIAGFRYQDTFPSFFLSMPAADRAAWANDLAGRIIAAPENAPAVCLLDTGAWRFHSLLKDSLSENDVDTFDPEWGKEAVWPHGTEMAGVALFGDLVSYLENSEEVTLQHRLESIKILPNIGENPEELYGYITQEAVYCAQRNAPHRKRVYCMAITADKAIEGKPTAWSSMVDQIAFASNLEGEEREKQLFLISVGNIRDTLGPDDYLALNDLEDIESPAQSWNAISVGAITEKSFADESSLANWNVMAPLGSLSPVSRTSVNWLESSWPIKPDIVMEGGNLLHDGSFVAEHEDLSVLTTCKDNVLSYFNCTSLATAQAARLAAILQSEYEHFWPETLRGLIVHSANWNGVMLEGQAIDDLRMQGKLLLLRRYGYGVPDIERARRSAQNSVCLVIQDALKPFCLSEKTKQTVVYHEMNLHSLPWPADLLREQGDLTVRLKVTLSYFIEPSPSDRLPQNKYSYMSHGLRFDLKRPLENEDQFKARINGALRDDNYVTVDSDDHWRLGPQTRNRGSVISDIWEGTASELAEQGAIGIFPVNGWWRTRKFLKRYDSIARYALLITLETDKQDLDIYTPIIEEIATETLIPIEIATS